MKTFLKFDFFLQSFLVIPTVLSAVSVVGFLFALFGMFFVGVWQLISCLVHLLAKQDNGWRKRHLFISIGALSLAGLLVVLADQIGDRGDWMPVTGILCGIGFLCLGGYYYYRTYKEFKQLRGQADKTPFSKDLLDYEEVIK